MNIVRKYLLSSVYRDAANDAGAGDKGGADKGGADKGSADKGAADKGAADKGAGDKGNAAPWYNDAALGLDDDLKQHAAGKGFTDVKAALKQGMDADRMARERNVLPAPDPKKLDEWEGWEKLGWTKDAAKYLPEKPQVKDGQVFDEDMFKGFVEDAHSLKLPADRVSALFAKSFERMQKRIGELDQAQARASDGAKKELDTKLQQEWGNDYKANTELSRRAMRALGVGIEDSNELEKVVGSPRLAKMFHTIGSALGEDSIAGLQSRGGNAGGDVHALRAELARLQGDKEFMATISDQAHALYSQNSAKRNDLLRKIAAAEARQQP